MAGPIRFVRTAQTGIIDEPVRPLRVTDRDRHKRHLDARRLRLVCDSNDCMGWIADGWNIGEAQLDSRTYAFSTSSIASPERQKNARLSGTVSLE
jgi:hypothetical protein